MNAPGSVRLVLFGTCAVKGCDHDAQLEVFHGDDECLLWVPLCPEHYRTGLDTGLEYVVEVHGFIRAGAGVT